MLAVVEYVDGACPAALAALTLLEAALECDRLDLVRQVRVDEYIYIYMLGPSMCRISWG